MTNKPTIKDCMEQAQTFASAWSLVGRGVFGTTMEQATAEKEALEAMLRAALAEPAQAVPAPGVPSDATMAVHDACGKIIETLAAIVNSPQSDDQFYNEVLQRDPVMAKVMEIKSQVDAIYKAVPLPTHPYMQRQQAAAPTQAAPVDAELMRDAQRYRWLRKQHWIDRLDCFIDAGRAAQGGV